MRKKTDETLQQDLKLAGKIPEHIAIIMDGNGRWAKKKGLPRAAGHRTGIESVRDIVRASAQLGIKYLTLYTFSTENWKRPKTEVSTLMRLLSKSLRKELKELNENNVRLTMIGDELALPDEIRKELEEAREKTSHNTGLTLVLALSYSGRWELTDAIRRIAHDAKSGSLEPEKIDASVIDSYLCTADIPDPDLMIRTSGEVRISNFLLWQLAYSEFYISKVLWPDFRRNDLYEAISDFQKRERRFGKVSEQLTNEKVKKR